MLTTDAPYADLGPDHFQGRIKDRRRHAERLAHQLRELGYPVALSEVA